MDASGVHEAKFADELYRLLLSSPVRDRVEHLAGSFGYDRFLLRMEVLNYVQRLLGWYADEDPELTVQPRHAS
jgi:hypothetical protein